MAAALRKILGIRDPGQAPTTSKGRAKARTVTLPLRGIAKKEADRATMERRRARIVRLSDGSRMRRIHIVVGLAGTGKSVILRSDVQDAVDDANAHVVLAPTGQAAW